MSDNFVAYLVIRKSKYNYDKEGRGAYLPYAPRIDKLYYGGIDRMQWFDLDEDYYNKSLPSNLIEIRNRIYSSDRALFGINFSKSFDDAKTVLEYCNNINHHNELISIESAYSDSEAKSNTILGCDIYCSGYGSMIREGVFTRPDKFGDYVAKLNEHGLFDPNEESIDSYIDTYKHISANDNIEKFEGEVKKFLVYKINVDLIN